MYPTEVEQVLYRNPKISKCCVVGLPDDTTGERVKAYVVLKPGETVDAPRSSIAWCRDPEQGLTGYRVPKAWEFREALPETLIGKVLRAGPPGGRAPEGRRRRVVSPLPVDLGDGGELRRYTLEDLDTLWAAVQEERERLGEWMPWVEATRTIDDQRAWLERVVPGEDLNGTGLWVDGEFAGGVGLTLGEFQILAEIGYWIPARRTRAEGSITRAARAMTDIGFGDFGVHRVVIRAGVENVRSRADPRAARLHARRRRARGRPGDRRVLRPRGVRGALGRVAHTRASAVADG